MEVVPKSHEAAENHLKQYMLRSCFWENFLNVANKSFSDVGREYACVGELTRAFQQLFIDLAQWLDVKDEDTLERYFLIVKAGLLLKKPKRVDEILRKIYENSFDAYRSLNENNFLPDDVSTDEEEGEDIFCSACKKENDICSCALILENVIDLNKALSQVRLTEHFCNPAIVNIIYSQLTGFIDKHVKGDYAEAWVDRVFTWTNKGLVAWVQFITSTFGKECENGESNSLSVEEWQERLSYFVYKALAEMRILELFEIIVEYPDSLPAIDDLKECLTKTETRQLLTESLRTAFENRLLHPAVNTDDILTQYVSTIRTLRELDPSGVILENVCSPLRKYLRGREDTIKCIITCLTDQETGPDLADELLGDGSQKIEIESDGEDWEPDPIDACRTDLTAKSDRTADIINILVNIYGSQDMFVSQYRILLADRILTNFSYDVSNERRYMELLKRRFGENHLLYCDVMLKDIQDSQRINRHIKHEMDRENRQEKEKSLENEEEIKDEDSPVEFNSFILSSVFWPTLSKETVEPPANVKRLMEKYMGFYEQSKGTRELEWLNAIGSVEIEVELEDNSLKTFNVTPGQATLLLTFQEKDEWTLNELSTAMNLSKSSLRSRISYWIGCGVIQEKQNDVFVTLHSFQSHAHGNDASIYESDDDTGAVSGQNQKDEELQVYWSYVVGMLTNMGSLPPDRILSMLQMFSSQDTSTQCTVDDVKTFLQGKVAKGELLYVGGMYKLPKSA